MRATVEREGGSYSVVSVRIRRRRADDARARHAGRAPRRRRRVGRRAGAGGAPADADEPLDPDTSGIPAFMVNYDMRWALQGDGGVPGWGGWIRAREPRALDAPLVAAMTDAWAPAAFAALGRFAFAPTLDLTIHVRRPLPPAGMAPADHALCHFSSRLAVGGVGGGRRAVDARRAADAQSRQLALVRELRA